MSLIFIICSHFCFADLIELVFNAAGLQSQGGVLVLFHPFDNLYHLMVVLSTDLINLGEVDVVWNKAALDAISQQRHNLIGVPKNGKNLND